MSVAVVVPTMSLMRMHENFHDRVREHVPDAEIIYVINGDDPPDVKDVDRPDGVHLVVSGGVFNNAVVAGLRYALALGSRAIVRMDSEEHPPEVLPAIIDRVESDPVWVVDLSFEPHVTIRPGTADSYHNLHVIPAVVSSYAKEELYLTGAHGFMVFAPQVVAQVIPFVADVVERVEGVVPRVVWGADTLLAVCAAKLGFDVSVTHVNAEEMRDRPEEKCVIQLRDTLAVMNAFESFRLDGVVTAEATSKLSWVEGLLGGAR